VQAEGVWPLIFQRERRPCGTVVAFTQLCHLGVAAAVHWVSIGLATPSVTCVGCHLANCHLQELMGPWGAAESYNFRNRSQNALLLRAPSLSLSREGAQAEQSWLCLAHG